jgi:hypothetical protein
LIVDAPLFFFGEMANSLVEYVHVRVEDRQFSVYPKVAI